MIWKQLSTYLTLEAHAVSDSSEEVDTGRIVRVRLHRVDPDVVAEQCGWRVLLYIRHCWPLDIWNWKYESSTINRKRGGSVNSKWYCPSLLLEFDYVLILPLRYVALTIGFALVKRSCDSEVLYALFYPWCGGHRALGQNPVWERSQSRVCLFLKSIFRITVCAQYVSLNVEITVSPCQQPVCCPQSCSCRPPQTDNQSQFEATWEEPGLWFWRNPIEIKIIPYRWDIIRLKALESYVWWSFYLKAATSARV